MLGRLKRHWKAFAATAGLLLLVLLVLYERCGLAGCPDTDALTSYMPREASTIVDNRGTEIGKLFLARRVIVPLYTLPKHLPAAFVAVEDRRFYQHHGVDWRRVFGAAYQNIKSLDIAEGSSTITMQLARNVFHEKLPAHKKTIFRKIAEARVARDIEKKFTKEEILELYLNQIYFGQGAWGIEAAAREYFGKPSSQLSLAESATLASLPRAPSRYNPRSNPEVALKGRKLVLERMVDEQMIAPQQAAEAAGARLPLRHGKPGNYETAPYFVQAVRNLLEDELGDAIYSEGYTIHTTLDATLQRVLEEELARQLRAVESGAYGRFRHPTLAQIHADTAADDASGTKYLQAAAIFMDTGTGDIRALLGGRSFEDSEFNRALMAKRQPGSTFKPFVYATAFDQGYTPTHRLHDGPLRVVLDRDHVWEPKNYDGRHSDDVTMRDALAQSKNIATVRLATEIGIPRIIETARRMGLSGRIPAVPSVVLGSVEVTPIEMTAAFAAFANLGDRPEPRFITRVVDRHNHVVWAPEVKRSRVIEPATAFMTVSLMQDVIDHGTAASVRQAGYQQPAAGKTGTTNHAVDVWFIGFTPTIVGTIWMGFDKRTEIVPCSICAELVAPVWGRVMLRTNQPSPGWTPPAGVETHMVDRFGNLTASNCSDGGEQHREYFLDGTAPPASCSSDKRGYRDRAVATDDSVSRQARNRQDQRWWTRVRRRIFGAGETDRIVQKPAPRARPAPSQLPRNSRQVPPSQRLLGAAKPTTAAPDTKPAAQPIPTPASQPPTPQAKDTVPRPQTDTMKIVQ